MIHRSTPGFLLWHLAIPLAGFALALFLLEQLPVDLWLADRWYALQGGAWAWRDSWLAYELIHHHGKQFIIAVGVVLLGLFAASYRVERLRRYRRLIGYVLSCMALLPSLIASSKRFSPVPCPWDLQRYGGDEIYRHNFEYAFGAAASGHCFPAGHASAGFALLAVYFAALPFARRPAWYLLPGLAVGWIFALGQQARGAHFLSHDLWTAALCWFGALGLFFAFRLRGWVPQESLSP